MSTENIITALRGTPRTLTEINDDLRGDIKALRLEIKSLELRNKMLELQLMAYSEND